MTGWRRSRIGEVKTETELGREERRGERERVKGRERGQRRERNTDRDAMGLQRNERIGGELLMALQYGNEGMGWRNAAMECIDSRRELRCCIGRVYLKADEKWK